MKDIKILKHKSRYIAKLLRHEPEDLSYDKDGYVLVDDLLSKLDITKEELDYIVDTNDKKRFGYDASETKIRASQGHSKSLDIDIKMKIADRIDFLYHGTARKNLESILKTGLISVSRKHVHLSKDIKTATTVGLRHSKDIIIVRVNSARMRADGLKIYVSDNDVYLTDSIDPKYLEI